MTISTSPIPFTVIGGFLGSGKTTLLKRILSGRNRLNYAVLVNDFGALNIDADLIAAQGGRTVRLENGCICCNLATGLMGALFTVLKTRPRPERILVEASGVADPARIADVARLSPSLALDGVIVLADAEKIREHRADPYVGEMIDRQLAAATVLILNKCELIDTGQLAATNSWLRQKAPNTPIIETCYAEVSLAQLCTGPSDKITTPEHHEPGHSENVRSWSFETRTPFDRRKLEALLASLPASIIRVKGFVRFDEAPQTLFELQMSAGRWTLSEYSGAPGTEHNTRIVLLGNNAMPGPEVLNNRFLAALAQSTPPFSQKE